ncbi:MAG: exonuclease SbcCD subunit D [Anaerolineales bacterium]|nr:exonuclease SbcCD subunit D [Anaerolineales bacterium]
MTEPVRVLHFADLHIGMENYGQIDPVSGTSSRVRDFLNRLDEVVSCALEQEADLVVFAGDAFKTRDPDPTQQREFAHRIKILANQMPVLLLAGNHDIPSMSARASSVDIYAALDVPNVIVGSKPGGQVVETKRGPVYLAWMPYPMRNRLLGLEEHREKTIDELEGALRLVVADILAGLAQKAAAQDMPRLLCAHFSVAEAKLGSERTVMLGRDIAVIGSTLADPAWDYIALGHIHKHQVLNPEGYPPMVYSGSLERIDFGEQNEEKGFCWVELARGETTWRFVPVHARPFRTVTIDVREEEEPMALVLHKLEDFQAEESVVRVQLTLRAEQEAALQDNRILAALEQASSVSIQRDIKTDLRTRLGENAPQTLTPLELVERYFSLLQEPVDRIPVLLEKAESLIHDSDQA